MRLIQELIKALQIIDNTNTATQVLDYVIKNPKLYPALELVTLLGKIKVPQLYGLLKNHILSSLHNDITIGSRSADDWYIDAKSDCTCEHCIILNEFMRSKTDTHKKWPINQNIRLHIIDMIKNLEVPISYEIEANGSPHKLLLTKFDLIHTLMQKQD